jgi:hypothetical protein
MHIPACCTYIHIPGGPAIIAMHDPAACMCHMSLWLHELSISRTDMLPPSYLEWAIVERQPNEVACLKTYPSQIVEGNTRFAIFARTLSQALRYTISVMFIIKLHPQILTVLSDGSWQRSWTSY